MKADITLVLDRSGSMSSCKAATIDGFNEFIDAQLAVPGEAVVSLAQFDDQYDSLYEAKKLSDEGVKLTEDTFIPRGSTRLLDAIGKTIVRTGERIKAIPEGDRPDKVIFVIITDGHENASVEYNHKKIFEMIRLQEETYSWEFVFIGADQDAIDTGSKLGVRGANCMDYAGTEEGTRGMYDKVSCSVKRMRTSGK
jgi:hypothetical protein